jgi:hypothetical protein
MLIFNFKTTLNIRASGRGLGGLPTKVMLFLEVGEPLI